MDIVWTVAVASGCVDVIVGQGVIIALGRYAIIKGVPFRGVHGIMVVLLVEWGACGSASLGPTGALGGGAETLDFTHSLGLRTHGF